ncbi:DMT family transporter [Phanerochaete sordida]|uniref:DMT family transporter n=1 Tax=Phanerochaete sordida TaxID=48140 RepID=A0A9P3GEW1_9APHY|nr:DMT family transporter [Phanerochaete sordida]
MTTARAAYVASTPDRSTFFPSPEHDPSGIRPPTNTPVLPAAGTVSYLDRAQDSWNVFKRKTREVVKNNTGMLLVAGSQGFFALMNVAVKTLNNLDPPVTAMELVCVRMTITWLCCVSYMYITKVPDPFLGPKGVRLLLVLRGFCGFFGLFGVYYSLQFLSLSDATVLTFIAPMCATVTGAVFLGESLSWRQAGAGLCSLCGVILIARPAALFGRASEIPDITLSDGTGSIVEDISPSHHVTAAQRLGAVGVAMLGVCGATGAYTTIRAIGKRAHPLHNIVSFSTQCVIVSTVSMIAMRTQFVLPMRLDWIAMLLMIGVFGFFAQVLLTMGLQREAVGRGTMAVYTQVVYAMTFDQIFFHSAPSLLSVFGTLIIVFSAIYVAVTKEDTGKHKRARSQAVSVEDISLEEGLLANQEEPAELEPPSKEARPSQDTVRP